jgi:hypothetical protein
MKAIKVSPVPCEDLPEGRGEGVAQPRACQPAHAIPDGQMRIVAEGERQD